MTSIAEIPRLGTWPALLARETREHPLRSVAVALGVGFVLGGGLSSRLTTRIVRAGAGLAFRIAIVPLMAQGLIGNFSSSSHDEHNTRRRTHEAQ